MKAPSSVRKAAYDQIDRFLRNNLHDDDYADYSAALDSLYTAPQPAKPVSQWIAASDELLAALKRIVDWDAAGLALTEDHVAQARAAIAKVEGGAA